MSPELCGPTKVINPDYQVALKIRCRFPENTLDWTKRNDCVQQNFHARTHYQTYTEM